MVVHQNAGGKPLCNIHRRWSSCNITSTNNVDNVTCKKCNHILKTKFGKE